MLQRIGQVLDIVAGIIATFGALNFALGGLVGLNLIRTILGPSRSREQISYAVAGLSALWFGVSLVRRGLFVANGMRGEALHPGPRLAWRLVPEEPTTAR